MACPTSINDTNGTWNGNTKFCERKEQLGIIVIYACPHLALLVSLVLGAADRVHIDRRFSVTSSGCTVVCTFAYAVCHLREQYIHSRE